MMTVSNVQVFDFFDFFFRLDLTFDLDFGLTILLSLEKLMIFFSFFVDL